MDFLKNRKAAVAIFVAVVVVFSLIGCHISLNRACRGVENVFFDRTQYSGYDYFTAPGDQLNACVNYANRLLSVINGSDALTEDYTAVLESSLALSEALERRDISEIYTANSALSAAVSAADEKVRAGAPLRDSSDDYETIVSDFFSAQRVAAQSPYNDIVDAFISGTANAFPTGILRRLAFVRLPEKFA